MVLNRGKTGLESTSIAITLQSRPWLNQVLAAISKHRFLFSLAVPCLGGGRRPPPLPSPLHNFPTLLHWVISSTQPSCEGGGLSPCRMWLSSKDDKRRRLGGGQANPWEPTQLWAARRPEGLHGWPESPPIQPFLPAQWGAASSPNAAFPSLYHHSYLSYDRPPKGSEGKRASN